MKKPGNIIAQRQMGSFEVKVASGIVQHTGYFSVSAEKNRPKIKRKKRSVFRIIQSFNDYQTNGIIFYIQPNDPKQRSWGFKVDATLSDILGKIKPHLPADVYEMYESQAMLLKMQYGGK